ncbi:MAG: hypothetical protein ACI4XC_04005 [Eubacterium sp.]
MKKGMMILLAVLLLVSLVFAACAAKDKQKDTDGTTASANTENNLENDDTEFGFETETVTDDNGKEVTDSKGNVVTTEVAVVYKKDKNNNTYAQKLDADGKGVTDKKGNAVTVKTKVTTTKKTTTTAKSTEGTASTTAGNKNEPASSTTEDKTTATTKKNVELTKDASTTKFDGKEVVPKTSEKGEEVNFSEADQEIISSMLEVPYLYRSSYENSDGIPIDTAVYTAVWMAQREGGTGLGKDAPYASNPIILNLFKFYGNTVVNFKTKCNSISNSPITYVSSKDQFVISEFTEKQQSVVITKIEDLGNNNFYKITGSVKNAGKISQVIAIVQKNRLEPTLGFSIKALKWS